jgi:2,3-bisphosphoglycerate-independent phosphoglycerate mutase
LVKIGEAIADGSFNTNDAITGAVERARVKNEPLHIVGLVSDGGVHSHTDHLEAMVEMAVKQGVDKVYVHAFLDGRDTPPKSAQASIDAMEAKFKTLGGGQFASLIGRFYAMDRDQRWDRVETAYHLLTDGVADFEADTATTALAMAYDRDEKDEFVQATRVGSERITMGEGDAVVFMNFRSDRARELTVALTDPDFSDFQRPRHLNLASVTTLTEYKKDFSNPVAFPSSELSNVLGAYLADQGKKQLRISETEKYAHVTFFFNGGQEQPFDGEDRILIPSPQVKTYDMQPAMEAPEVAEKFVEAIHSQKYDAIMCNFANADMVGHSGQYDAAVQAIEALDTALGQVWEALQAVGGEMIVTADHGNAELMLDESTGQAHTAHTSNPVPLIYAGRVAQCAGQGTLSDIAPTMLSLMGLPIPDEMGKHLLVKLI